MNVSLGFGTTETEVEAAEEAAFVEYVEAEYRRLGISYVSDDLVKAVEKWVNDRTKVMLAVSKTYEKAENFPDRYSYYYGTVAQSASDIVLIANFSHINRRHGLSRDGWALLQSRRLFHVSALDIDSPQ